MSEPKFKRRKLTEYRSDPANANSGTERGRKMLSGSVGRHGPVRSGVVDGNDVFVAGNKTKEELAAAGIEDVLEVTVDDNTWVVVKKEQWDLLDDSPDNEARRYAYEDNRTSELDLSWDPEQILADSNAGFDFSALFAPYELNTILSEMREEFDYQAAWEGMPEFEQSGIKPYQSIIVHFKTPEDVERFASLIEQTITEKTRWLYYPKQERENLKQYRIVDES